MINIPLMLLGLLGITIGLAIVIGVEIRRRR